MLTQKSDNNCYNYTNKSKEDQLCVLNFQEQPVPLQVPVIC